MRSFHSPALSRIAAVAASLRATMQGSTTEQQHGKNTGNTGKVQDSGDVGFELGTPGARQNFQETAEQVGNRFMFLAPTPEARAHINQLSLLATEMSKSIVESIPQSRERALALTNLEQAFSWSCLAIVRYGGNP